MPLTMQHSSHSVFVREEKSQRQDEEFLCCLVGKTWFFPFLFSPVKLFLLFLFCTHTYTHTHACTSSLALWAISLKASTC